MWKPWNLHIKVTDKVSLELSCTHSIWLRCFRAVILGSSSYEKKKKATWLAKPKNIYLLFSTFSHLLTSNTHGQKTMNVSSGLLSMQQKHSVGAQRINLKFGGKWKTPGSDSDSTDFPWEEESIVTNDSKSISWSESVSNYQLTPSLPNREDADLSSPWWKQTPVLFQR